MDMAVSRTQVHLKGELDYSCHMRLFIDDLRKYLASSSIHPASSLSLRVSGPMKSLGPLMLLRISNGEGNARTDDIIHVEIIARKRCISDGLEGKVFGRGAKEVDLTIRAAPYRIYISQGWAKN